MKQQKIFNFVIYFLSFSLILIPFIANGENSPSPTTTGSTEIDSLNKSIKQHQDHIVELQNTINTYKKQIEQKQTEAVSLKNQLSILDTRIKEIQAQEALTQEKITQTNLQISALQQIIAEKTVTLTRQKTLIASMLRKIQSDDQKNTLEILLTNDSFADFYSQLQNLSQVNSDLSKSVQLLQQTKTDLEVKQTETEKQKKALEDLKQQLEDNKQEYKGQVNLKTNLLTDTKNSEARYQTLVSSLKKEYQITENQIQNAEAEVRKKLAAQKNSTQQLPTGNITFDWPVPSRYINATFHDPDYPFRSSFEHTGIDIKASFGSPVHAAASGYVARRTYCTTASCYAHVDIVHSSTLSTLYGHLSQITVQPDQFVTKGDIIGYSGGAKGAIGSGPWVTGAHLHFEVRSNGIPVDPLGYLIQ
jgi:murein DD-endopeptidase MepM/ murein hydrolase activator NlpD